MDKLINLFADDLKKIFPQINIDFYYRKSDDQFIILHDNKELEYNTPEFYDVVGSLMTRHFHSNCRYNMVFDYDYFGELFTKDYTLKI